jgi:hypothetical protein
MLWGSIPYDEESMWMKMAELYERKSAKWRRKWKKLKEI